MDIQPLIINFVKKLQDNKIGFGETKLVKYLYLAEIEYYRRKRKRLTSLDWTYYKFGPYIMNWNELIDSPSLEVEKDRDDFTMFSIREYMPIPNIPDEINQIIDLVIRKYSKLNLNELLELVYSDTEPMLEVTERGELLNFGCILPQEYFVIKPSKLTQKDIAKITQKYSELIKNAK